MLTAAYRVGSAIYYLSTDYVFDGERGMYTEDDTPRPVNYYGLTKLLAEEITRALGGSIVRVACIYGAGPGRVNFGKIMADKLMRGRAVTAVTDQWSSPTLNTIIGEASAKLLEMMFAETIARYFRFNEESMKLIKLSNVNYRARRPRG